MHHTFAPTPDLLLPSGVYRMPIEGLLYVPHRVFSDNRGFYAELARIPEIEAVTGRPFVVQQTNLSFSQQNVIRGLHAENWEKLLTVVQGSCFCAWLDIRPESPTFGDTLSMTVGVNEPALFGSVFVSAGIANSFCVTDGPVSYLYAVNQLYAKRDTSGDVALSLFDPQLAIPWPIPREQMIVSERDLNAVSFKERFPQYQESHE